MTAGSDTVKSYGKLVALAFAIIALGSAGSAAVGHMVKAMRPPPDARYPVDLLAGLVLPAPVIRDYNGALLVLAISLGTVAIVCWLGFKLAVAAAQHLPALLAICGAQAIALLSLSFAAWGVTGDVYQYVLLGRTWQAMGLNPYFFSVPLPTADPSTAAMLRYWGNPPPLDVYGPLWTLFAGLISQIATGTSLWIEFLIHRWSAIAAALIATAGLLYKFKNRHSQPVGNRVASVFAFHPLVAFECAVNGHNDMLMVAPAVWAFALAAEHPLAAGLLVGVAAAVKYPALVALPFVVLLAWRRRWIDGLTTVAGAAAVVALCFLPFWRGWATITRPLSYSGTFETSLTWLAVISARASGHAPEPQIFVLVSLLVFAAITLSSLLRFASDARAGHIIRSVTALVLSLPTLHPWYVEWLIPAVGVKHRWASYAWWFGVFSLAFYPLYLLRPPASPTLAHAIVIGTTIFVLAAPAIIALKVREPVAR